LRAIYTYVSVAFHTGQSMKRIPLVIGCIAIMSLVFAVYGQTAGQQARPAAPTADAVGAQKALITQYCQTCHSDKAASAGMDSARKINFDKLDVAHVEKNGETWELIVRKLRAGMMPPANARRPEPAVYKGFITWLENELDRTAAPYAPPPGLHRLNRTEYANVGQGLAGSGHRSVDIFAFG
jgi:mono/diheme cytochrome c family protein